MTSQVYSPLMSMRSQAASRGAKSMLIRLGYDIRFQIPQRAEMVAMLHVHPSRSADLLEPDVLRLDPRVAIDLYTDSFGNICSRFEAPAGNFRLWSSTLIEDSGEPDRRDENTYLSDILSLPPEAMQYLLASRYCEVDCLSDAATALFGHLAPGWPTVKAICNWVHQSVSFGYQFARVTKTAVDVYKERQGVCRDFQ